MNTIGYCTTCFTLNCPTPTIRGKQGVNCSHWTPEHERPDIDEHDTCPACENVMSTDDGHYPLRCVMCEFELEAA